MNIRNGMAFCGTLAILWFSGIATAEEPAEKKIVAGAETKNTGSVMVPTILEAKYAILKINPPTLVITAVGEVPTGGFTGGELHRVVYVTEPKDGIQDFIFTAVKPAGIVTQVISKIEAKPYEWKKYDSEAPWIKGFRIHGLGDGVIEVKFGGK